MNVERALRKYLNGTGSKVKENRIFEYYNGDGNAIFNVFFVLADEEIENINDTKALDRLVEVLKTGTTILHRDDNLDRKTITRKINKLQEKMDRILSERKKKYKNINKIKGEFNKVVKQLERLLELCMDKNTKQYDLMSFLVEENKDMSSVELTLKKLPNLVNVKDKNETSLFRNIVRNYLMSLDTEETEDSMYYDNLISLLLSQSSFQLTEKEKRECLDLIYNDLNKLSFNKKSVKRNQKHIAAINKLLDRLKGISENHNDIEEIASKYQIHIHFPPSIQEEVKLAKIRKEGQMEKREWIDDYTISMDKEGTMEIDDALSCERLSNGNFLYKIHSASILGYFPYHSKTVEEAIYRNRAIYLSQKNQSDDGSIPENIPIFPLEFAADIGSLKQGEKRLTRSYIFEITPTGEIVDERFIKSIVQNNSQLTYREANKIIQSGSENPAVQETMNCLLRVTDVLEQQFRGTRLYDLVKENTSNSSNLRVKKEGAEKIVFYASLLVGTRVANFFAKNNYPFIYRVLETNERNNLKLQDMIDNLNHTYGEDQFKKLYPLMEEIYPRSWYATSGRHDGLGVEHHGHCTSALRRGADIINEYALEVCCDKTPTTEEVESLRKEIASKVIELNARQSAVDYFVKECQKKYHR